MLDVETAYRQFRLVTRCNAPVTNHQAYDFVSCVIEHGYDTVQIDKDFLDAKASSSAFLICFVLHTPLYLV